MLSSQDLTQIRNIVQSGVRSEVETLEKKMGKRFDKLERKLDYAINFLDRDYLKLLHRVEKIEEHLNLTPTSI